MAAALGLNNMFTTEVENDIFSMNGTDFLSQREGNQLDCSMGQDQRLEVNELHQASQPFEEGLQDGDSSIINNHELDSPREETGQQAAQQSNYEDYLRQKLEGKSCKDTLNRLVA